jgi:hypothetical protein
MALDRLPTFVTSDSHFFHEKMTDYSRRPYDHEVMMGQAVATRRPVEGHDPAPGRPLLRRPGRLRPLPAPGLPQPRRQEFVILGNHDTRKYGIPWREILTVTDDEWQNARVRIVALREDEHGDGQRAVRVSASGSEREPVERAFNAARAVLADERAACDYEWRPRRLRKAPEPTWPKRIVGSIEAPVMTMAITMLVAAVIGAIMSLIASYRPVVSTPQGRQGRRDMAWTKLRYQVGRDVSDAGLDFASEF